MGKKSPFKFLDAYDKEDKDIFFGRDQEVEVLYDLVFQSNLTLLYGESGTGKTSLVQCGLANRFEESDWFNIYVRRNTDINVSLSENITKHAPKEEKRSVLSERLKQRRIAKRKETQSESEPSSDQEENELIKELRSLYKYYLKPIYLIFDQFEELFVLGNRAEQERFYDSIAKILENENYCRVILIMREEMIAQLYDFEKVIPFLFDNRLRVERMSRNRVKNVIAQNAAKFDIELESDQVPEQIIDVLSEGEGQVELTYLQVFLDRLYQQAVMEEGEKIRFTTKKIQELGSIEDVLGDFLVRQTQTIQEDLSKNYPGLGQATVSKVLSQFVSLEGTKRPYAQEQILVANIPDDALSFIIERLEQSRILRFENDLYELSHDALALRIATQRSTEEVALIEIAKLVKDRFQAFEATRSYLNANELQLLSSFEDALKDEQRLNPEHWKFIVNSKRVNRTRRLTRIGLVAGIIGVLTVATLYSNQQRIEAKRSKAKADSVSQALSETLVNLKEKNYQLFLQEGNTHMALSNYGRAMEAYQLALSFDSTRREVMDSLAVANSRSGAKQQFDQFMAEGDALMKRNNDRVLVDARQKYRAARNLGYNNGFAQSKIDVVNGKLSIAFDRFKEAGDNFFRASNKDGYRFALDSYKQAARIRPNDTYIRNRITECQSNLR